jgi:hypothetical protein
MAIETLSFDAFGNGWNTFHSWKPDCMVGVNNNFYTFKNGSLWKHHENSNYGEFYNDSGVPTQYEAKVTLVFNDSPTEVKIFKVLSLDSSDTWDADITTDMTTGLVDRAYYKEKEGDYYAYIRRDPNAFDTLSVSTQGVGTVESYSSLVITFGFVISASLSIGDAVYIRETNGDTTLVGDIVSYTNKTITVDAAAEAPAAGDKIIVVKDSTAESNGLRGAYMKVELTNNDSTSVDLFDVSTEVIKSYQ